MTDDNKKSIYSKIIITNVVFLLFFIIFIYLFYNLFLLKNFVSLERDQVIRNLNRVDSSLSTIANNQNIKLKDWSSWDDTYKFITDKNKAYIDSNLTNETLTSLRINAIVFLNDKNEIVYSKYVDIDNGKDLPQSNLVSFIKNNSDYITSVNSGNTNIIDLPEGEMVISVANILKSDNSGKPKGNIIFGSFIADKVVQDITKVVGFPVVIHPYSSYNESEDISIVKTNISKTNKYHLISNGNNTIDGYEVVYDIYDKPIFITEVQLPRDIYNQGKNIVYVFSIIVTLIMLTFFIVLLILIDKFVLHRLIKLKDEVYYISDNSDFSRKIEEGENDEIGDLIFIINKMFEKIKISHEKEIKFDESSKITNEKIKNRMEEIDKLNKLMVGRELKMIELKKENAKLKEGKVN